MFPDAVRLVPVQLDFAYPTTRQPDCGNALQLSPTAPAELPAQKCYLTDRVADRNRFVSVISPTISKYMVLCGCG
jgi:hypothetical protein